MGKDLKVTLGYKYRLYPTDEQKQLLDHQMFIYNQAYNICINFHQKQWETNKELPKEKRKHLKAVEIDAKVKNALKQRELPFKTVVTQQARINMDKALKSALTLKERGFPKFKNSKFAKQSFNWNNQGYKLLDSDNPRYRTLRLMGLPIKMIYHRNLPDNYKMNAITISKDGDNYYVAFSITFNKCVSEISAQNVDLSKAVGIDLNINDIALSDGTLIPTNSKSFAKTKYDEKLIRLMRKQSRRVLHSKKTKTKLGGNFRKTQKRINKVYEKAKRRKEDRYHKTTSELSKQFDLIAVEHLYMKNMTKRAKLKNVKQKSGLNKSILSTSFYQFLSMLSYKAMLNGKLFTKVPPQYTSKGCSSCGLINNELTLKQREFWCECGSILHRDVNAALNILRLGLESFGLGTSLADLKCKAFRSTSLEAAS